MESKEVEQAAPTMATLPLQAATQAVQFDPGWYRCAKRRRRSRPPCSCHSRR